jgi:hypothetical protein
MAAYGAAVSRTAVRGSAFTRTAASIMLNGGVGPAAFNYASEAFPDTPGVGLAIRAARGPTDTGASGGALIAPGTHEFLELVTPRTILGRLARLRKVPLDTNPALATGGAVNAWLGENAPVPVGQLTWTPGALPPLKFGGIAVATRDMLALATPTAEAAFRDVLVDSAVQFLDASFIGNAAAAANVSPAGIRNGVGGVASVDAPTDMSALLDGFATLDGVSIIMSERNAVGLSMAAPGSIINGKLAGVVPLIASSAAGTNVVAVHAPSVLFGDDGRVELDVAEHALVIMDDDPAAVVQAPGAPPVQTSLWQRGLVGLKILRYINWSVARAGAVSVITGATY